MPEVVPIIPEQELVPRAARGLSSHVRQFRKRNQGLSRWIALAVWWRWRSFNLRSADLRD